MEKKENINSENTLQSLNVVKPIYNITPFTLLDYPDKTACILWFAGCNMKCVYCYNPEIVFGKGKISFDETLNFLKKRKGLLDGVVLSGGECTSHKHIKDLLQLIKNLGFLVKIDTNGSHPEKIKNLIEENLVDYIALDFKAMPQKFHAITKSNLYNEFENTLKHLIDIDFPFEVRTTVHSELLNMDDIQSMINMLEKFNYHNDYYLQYFRNESETIEKLSDSKRNYLDFSKLSSQINVILRNAN